VQVDPIKPTLKAPGTMRLTLKYVALLSSFACEYNLRRCTKAGRDKTTPLHTAAEKGHEAVVRALVAAGADVKKLRNDGRTPLFIAAKNGHEAIVAALMEAGGDVRCWRRGRAEQGNG